MADDLRQLTYSVPYNLLLLTAGAVIFGIGVKAIALPHGLITGGASGVALLLYYWTGWLKPGQWYFLVNTPIFILGWFFVSRRFFFYSLYGMLIMTLAMDWVTFTIPVTEPVLAVLAGGTLIGTGSGIILNSLGSGGGNDIIAIILNQRFNFRIGTFFFLFNISLFAFSLGRLPLDLVLFSLAMSFVTSQTVNYFLSIFNQRKLVLIISEHADAIAAEILSRIHRGATYLEGRGAFSGRRKDVLLTVVNNYQLKRVEELVFSIDPAAFVIMENTFNVLGKGFSHRKVY
ncbi:MAG TPA: YitT family protein [Desulfobacteraceae bacterium]|nr:YitT family protein [Deltaproteobacteria bacterium]HDI59851.1 YitT family protein [Desulfobacteraceae bacterium]